MSQQINLLQLSLRNHSQAFGTRTLLVGLAALLAAGLAVGELLATQNRTLQRTLAQAEQRVAELRDQSLRLAKELGARPGAGALADEIASLEERLRARRALLAGMHGGPAAEAEGPSRYLAALARRTVSGVWLTGVQLDHGQVTLRGRVLESDLVPAYLRALQQEPLFNGRPVSELRVSTAEASPGAPRHVEFSIRIPLEGVGA